MDRLFCLYLVMIKSLQEFFENNNLPGKDFQYELAPYRKAVKDIDYASKNPRLSAVCLLLYPVNGILHNVLIQRPTYEGVHSAQIAFPGGKVEESDLDLWMTAKRETFEEVGVKMDSLKLIGALTEVYIPPSNFLVQPYVAYLDHEPSFIPDAIEVDKIIEYPAEYLLRDDILKETRIQHSNQVSIKAPYLDIHGHVVWGATGMMLMEFRQILKQL